MTVDKWWNHVGVGMHMDTDPAVDAKGATVIASGTAGAITLDTGTQLFTPLQSTLFFTGEPNEGLINKRFQALGYEVFRKKNLGILFFQLAAQKIP